MELFWGFFCVTQAGFVRLIRDRATNRIVGVHVLASEGAEMLMEVAFAIKHGITAQQLSETFTRSSRSPRPSS